MYIHMHICIYVLTSVQLVSISHDRVYSNIKIYTVYQRVTSYLMSNMLKAGDTIQIQNNKTSYILYDTS